MIPVARNVWQQVEEGSPAFSSRRFTIRNDPQYIFARHRILGQLPPLIDVPEQRSPFLVSYAGRIEIRIKIGFRVVVSGDFVTIATYFVELNPPALAVLIVVFGFHVHHRRDSRKGLVHEPDDRVIAETDNRIRFDRVEQCPRLLSFQHGSLAAANDMLGGHAPSA